MNPNQVYYSSSSAGPSRGKRLLVFFGLLILGVGAIVLFLFLGNSSSGDNNQSNSGNGGKSQDSGTVLRLNVLSDPSFAAPKDMKEYTKDSGFVADVGDYTTKDGGCNLQFGVVTAIDLPGTTPEEIMVANLGTSSEYGAVGGDPVKISDLVLKEMNGSQRYFMPTYKFSYSRDDVNYLASFSISMIADGRRAYVRTYCANTGEAVPVSAFNKINAKAKEITVRAE